MEKRSRLQQLLANSVSKLVREELKQDDCTVSIDGLIGVTINSSDVILVKIDERINGATDENSMLSKLHASGLNQPLKRHIAETSEWQHPFGKFKLRKTELRSPTNGSLERSVINIMPAEDNKQLQEDIPTVVSEKTTGSLGVTVSDEQIIPSNGTVIKTVEKDPPSTNGYSPIPWSKPNGQIVDTKPDINTTDKESHTVSTQENSKRRKKSTPRRIPACKPSCDILKVPQYQTSDLKLKLSNENGKRPLPSIAAPFTPEQPNVSLGSLLLSTPLNDAYVSPSGDIVEGKTPGKTSTSTPEKTPKVITPKDLDCHLCGKTFTSQKGKRRHLDIHNGKVFRCDLCGATCSRKDAMMRHMKRKHGFTDLPADLPVSIKLTTTSTKSPSQDSDDITDPLDASTFALPHNLIDSIDSAEDKKDSPVSISGLYAARSMPVFPGRDEGVESESSNDSSSQATPNGSTIECNGDSASPDDGSTDLVMDLSNSPEPK